MAVTVQGGKELAAALAKYSTRWQSATMRDCLVEAAEPIRKMASRLAPSGDPKAPNLKNIEIMPLRRKGPVTAAVAIGPERAATYGFFVEYGTKYQAAHPFLRPAADGSVSAVIPILSAALWRELAAKGHIQIATAPADLGGGLV